MLWWPPTRIVHNGRRSRPYFVWIIRNRYRRRVCRRGVVVGIINLGSSCRRRRSCRLSLEWLPCAHNASLSVERRGWGYPNDERKNWSSTSQTREDLSNHSKHPVSYRHCRRWVVGVAMDDQDKKIHVAQLVWPSIRKIWLMDRHAQTRINDRSNWSSYLNAE